MAQPMPLPFAETKTTNIPSTTSETYLSTHLFVPYFIINSNGGIKRPEHLIAWWTLIFSFYVPDYKDYIPLRSLCRLFRDALKMPVWASFPHPNYPTLNGLMKKFNMVYQEDPNKAPKVVFVMEGTFSASCYFPEVAAMLTNVKNYVIIGYPLMIIGAGQGKTIIHGGFKIQGMKTAGMEVNMRDMTVMRSSGNGLYNHAGLSFLCTRMTFTQCARCGVVVQSTKGRLVDCVITQCRLNGVHCNNNALIELEGLQTKVDGNATIGDSDYYGLFTFSKKHSRIRLLFPLTKESVSTNNGGSRTMLNKNNYNSRKKSRHDTSIKTVTTFV